MITKFKIVLAALTVSLMVSGCANRQNNNVDTHYMLAQGRAQGTTWHITYKSFDGEDLTPKFDSILRDFDYSISTYNKESLLTKINNNEDIAPDGVITAVFQQSQRMYALTDGLFDPTCRPLVNAWGFGKHTDLRKPSQKELDSVLQFV
ncbi:MAG: FAD:protein FMN transferase, partial [Bacteroidales bacterium]|nr:FAD:protein FMN transferase [Bacteroidales bacterium]